MTFCSKKLKNLIGLYISYADILGIYLLVLRIKSDVTQQWAQSSNTVSYEKLVPSVIQWSGSDNWFQSKVHVQHSSVVQRVLIARCGSRSRTKPASESLCGDNACDVITLRYVTESRIQSVHRPPSSSVYC